MINLNEYDLFLISTTPKYSQCTSLKKKKLEQLQSKIDFGLDRLVL